MHSKRLNGNDVKIVSGVQCGNFVTLECHQIFRITQISVVVQNTIERKSDY